MDHYWLGMIIWGSGRQRFEDSTYGAGAARSYRTGTAARSRYWWTLENIAIVICLVAILYLTCNQLRDGLMARGCLPGGFLVVL